MSWLVKTGPHKTGRFHLSALYVVMHQHNTVVKLLQRARVYRLVRTTISSRSRTFLRRVLRLTPRSSAARI